MTAPTGARLPASWPAPAVIALALLVLSLGLPWSFSLDPTVYIPGSVTPGTCVGMYDGTLDCTPMQVSPGWLSGGGLSIDAGYRSGARVGLVVAIAALVIARRRADRRLLWGVPIGVGVALIGSGVTAGGGQLAAVLACAFVWVLIRGERSVVYPAIR